MTNPTAAAVIIGNEILSGRTLDVNTQEIALRLGEIGISFLETRTIPDDKKMIVDTIRELSPKYDYIFTTGGIGPTHDDITAESVAAAFDLPYVKNEKIYNIIKENYGTLGEEINSAREKMAYVPAGSDLIYNNVTKIPGFVTHNVFAMAGIPEIMSAMLNSSLPMLQKGKIVKSKSVDVFVTESKIADQFSNLQQKYKNVEMGSYPFSKESKHGTSLVLRSSDYDSLDIAFKELNQLLKELKQQ
ncbi:molybdopterin-binding protein [Rickettsiaceae bacterium]|nr:molybdopterin-binding protein [Rickettsiaceae bacterium]